MPDETLDPDELLTGGRAAAYAGMSTAMLYRLAKKAVIGQQIGGVWFFTRREIDAYKQAPKSKGGRPKSLVLIPTPVIRATA